MSKKLVSGNLTLAEGTCLALVAGGVTHGYDVAKHFQPESDIGEVFTLSNPVVYRTLKVLESAGFIASTDALGVRKQLKFTLRCTDLGRSTVSKWLNTPVTHLRDIRSEFLVKVLLRDAAGLDQEEFIESQREVLNGVIAQLLADKAMNAVAMWRREQARAVARFLDELAGLDSGPTAAPEFPDSLQLSARNQLQAAVVSVKHGDVLSSVKLEVAPGQTMTATITREATEDLSLAPGTPVFAVCKATDVLVARK